jgi:hypothetical protein
VSVELKAPLLLLLLLRKDEEAWSSWQGGSSYLSVLGFALSEGIGLPPPFLKCKIKPLHFLYLFSEL